MKSGYGRNDDPNICRVCGGDGVCVECDGIGTCSGGECCSDSPPLPCSKCSGDGKCAGCAGMGGE